MITEEANSTQDLSIVFLDWAATAPLCEEAYDAMLPYLRPGEANIEYGGNANSLYSSGRRAFSSLEEARSTIAHALGITRSDEIVFTSGATEANNAALFGIIRAIRQEAIQKGLKDFIPHIISSSIEHDAILEPLRRLKAEGCEVSFLKPDSQGFIEARKLAEAFQDNTVLVSIQSANNEIGSIQAIQELAEITHQHSAYFHTDAAQALGKIPFNLQELKVDAASFSAHKIGGPKGSGALYLKSATAFSPSLLGGGQEFGKRSGTQNVCAAQGFAAALRTAQTLQEGEAHRLRGLRDKLYAYLLETESVHASVEVEKGSFDYLPNIVSVWVEGMESETMILRLDMQGIEVSGGSACSSHSLEPSHVLTSLGLSGDEAHGSLRISMGRYTTEEDIDVFIRAFKASLRQK